MNDKVKSVPDISLSTPRAEVVGLVNAVFNDESGHGHILCEPLCLTLKAFSYEGFSYEPKLGEPNYPHFIKN